MWPVCDGDREAVRPLQRKTDLSIVECVYPKFSPPRTTSARAVDFPLNLYCYRVSQKNNTLSDAVPYIRSPPNGSKGMIARLQKQRPRSWENCMGKSHLNYLSYTTQAGPTVANGRCSRSRPTPRRSVRATMIKSPLTEAFPNMARPERLASASPRWSPH